MPASDARWYFAYGSNMDSESLSRRNIEVVESARASLGGYRLAFDLSVDLFRQEPRMANLRQAPAGTVHGVAHRIREQDLVRLDAEEFTYDRLPVDLDFYDGRVEPGCTYVVTDERFLCPEGLPSERYLHILQNGAREHDLDPEFCAWLDAHSAHPMDPDPGLPLALQARDDHPAIAMDQVRQPGPDGRPTLVAFGGWVFDFSEVDNPLARAFLTGRDATAVLVGRTLDLPAPHSAAQMHPKHWAWLNHALHDLVRVAPVAGALQGGLDASLANGAWRAKGRDGTG